MISVKGLRKSYDDFEAVRGIDLEVGAGEVFAFLGPNGAGKTTTVEILEGYRDAERRRGQRAGRRTRSGRRTARWRNRVGFVLQDSQPRPRADAARDGRAVRRATTHRGTSTRRSSWSDWPRRRMPGPRTLSGGQQRRLDVALALIGDPELLFLDEPTTGFDPSARRQAWDVIGGLRNLGKTVFLTTHYMDEAQALADRVAIISAGRIVAIGLARGPRRRPRGAHRDQLPASGRCRAPRICRMVCAPPPGSTPRPSR